MRDTTLPDSYWEIRGGYGKYPALCWHILPLHSCAHTNQTVSCAVIIPWGSTAVLVVFCGEILYLSISSDIILIQTSFPSWISGNSLEPISLFPVWPPSSSFPPAGWCKTQMWASRLTFFTGFLLLWYFLPKLSEPSIYGLPTAHFLASSPTSLFYRSSEALLVFPKVGCFSSL
jgi:hypothetical protein